MREPVQLQFDFMNDAPSPAAAEPGGDLIQFIAEVATVCEILGHRYNAERQAARQRFRLAA